MKPLDRLLLAAATGWTFAVCVQQVGNGSAPAAARWASILFAASFAGWLTWTQTRNNGGGGE